MHHLEQRSAIPTRTECNEKAAGRQRDLHKFPNVETFHGINLRRTSLELFNWSRNGATGIGSTMLIYEIVFKGWERTLSMAWRTPIDRHR